MALIENVTVVPPVFAASRSVYQFILDKDSGAVVANWRYYDADGNPLAQTKTVEKTGAEFYALCQELTLPNENIYDAMKRIIYTHMA